MSRDERISRFLSFILRHRPDSIGLGLDGAGWADVEELLRLVAASGKSFTRDDLERVARDCDKQRYAFSDDGKRIRASQGHSVNVDLGYAPAAPPETLWHGTVARFLASIRVHGLVRGARSHVHLSADRETAVAVGARRGVPSVLEVRAAEMSAAGHAFYLSANGVWLAERVPPEFLVFPGDSVDHCLGRTVR